MVIEVSNWKCKLIGHVWRYYESGEFGIKGKVCKRCNLEIDIGSVIRRVGELPYLDITGD